VRVAQPHGRPVQVDPIKPTLKAPRTKLWKLTDVEPLSMFAFKSNLRRYITVTATLGKHSDAVTARGRM